MGSLEVLALVLAGLAFPAVIDSVFTAILVAASRIRKLPQPIHPERFRWLVLVPARREGALVEPVLRAIGERASGAVRTVLLLDGEDPEAEAVARRLGAEVLVKTPEGPSKAAVIAWAVERLQQPIDEADGVMVLDVGSIPSPGFFDAVSIPPGAAAVQAFLGGKARGVGEAIRHSETFAQMCEDAGRQALGWGVRLRGTGTGMRPEVFRELSGKLQTQVEDLEASLLLAAAGKKTVLGPPDAVVADEKPEDVEKAAVQRARWLVGRWQLLFRQAPAFGELAVRNPLEGLAFLCEIWGRPFVLSVAVRLVLGAGLGLLALAGAARPAFLWIALVFWASAGLTAGAVLFSGSVPWRSVLALSTSWLRSILRLRSAVAGWLRAR